MFVKRRELEPAAGLAFASWAEASNAGTPLASALSQSQLSPRKKHFSQRGATAGKSAMSKEVNLFDYSRCGGARSRP